ncbi:MAG TPA: hypothetical protein VMB50_11665 [Myxococcales bacterium]|nr:hypothetical protein [Myxococcales bacterium]
MSWKLGRLLATTLALAGCGGAFGGGSNVTYYHIGTTGQSPLTGTNCASGGNDVVTIAGIDGNGTVAIYTLPGSNSYLLDIGSGGIEGSLTSGTYTFADSIQEITTESSNITKLVKTTVQITTSGPGFTGSYTQEQSCNSNDSSLCPGGGVAANTGDYDCTWSATVVGTQIPNPTQVSPQQAGVPTTPGPTPIGP